MSIKTDETVLEFAGDNPCVVLYDECTMVLTAASYWHVTASLAGIGRALFLITSEGGHLKRRIFADNPGVVGFLRTFNDHFKGFEGIGWPSEAEPAQFQMRHDSDEAALDCTTENGTVRLEWRDLSPAYLRRSHVHDFGQEPGRSYEVSTVILPAGGGSIYIDGKSQPGAVAGPYGNLPRSAFLAVCETWSRLKGAAT
jgi:hypothetical protein